MILVVSPQGGALKGHHCRKLTMESSEFKIDWSACIEMVERRENASRKVVPCEKCGSIQVQLTDWRSDMLKMKCRHCKHRFERNLNA